jgi:hypothetical protein
VAAARTNDDNLAKGYNLTDGDLASEIELVSKLVVAATSSERRLRQDEVDDLLGVAPKRDRSGVEPHT